MLLARKIVFYLFTLSFVIGAPLIVLYALGYIYKPGESSGLVKTGLVYLSSTPPGAAVYVGKRRYRKETPAMIRELLAGDYPVKLVLKGYQPWTQNVPVEGGKATVLENILLRPERWDFSVVREQPSRKLLQVPGSDYFLLKDRHKPRLWQVYDAARHKIRPLLKGSEDRAEEIEDIYTVPGSTHVMLHSRGRGGEAFLWTDIADEDGEVQNLTPLIVEKPGEIAWPSGQNRYAFAFQEKSLNRLDLKKMTVTPGFETGIRGFGFDDEHLYFLRGGDTFARTDLAGRNLKPLMQDSRLFSLLFGKEDLFHIFIYPGELVLFLGEDGRLITNRLPYELVEKDVRGFDMDRHERRLAVWKKKEIGIVDFLNSGRDDEIFERGPQLAWVFKDGRDIRQAFWIHEDAYLLFQDRDEVFLLELETYGKPRLYPLFEVSPSSRVFYRPQDGRLYFLDKDSGELMSVEIVPRQALLDMSIPLIEEERKKKEGLGL